MKPWLLLLFAFGCLETAHALECPVCGSVSTVSQRQALYHSIDPTSVAKLLAFYELYPETAEGQQALSRVWKLLAADATPPSIPFPKESLAAAADTLVRLIHRSPQTTDPALPAESLHFLNRLNPLPHRKLKGHEACSLDQLLALSSDQIDLSRALLITQFGETEESLITVHSYEAILDLMALQIHARLPKQPSPADKIQAINEFLFSQMHIRFPPHSAYAKDIDLYTFLPSVIDSRRGVCLGVSLLYLSLAQRLDLPLEIVTPPGHIFVRTQGPHPVNIETTARGIAMPDEVYLGVNTRSLKHRTLKEAIGLVYVNQAAVFVQKEESDKAIEAYEKARLFLPEDPLVKELLAYQHLFAGHKEEGEKLLQEVKGYCPEDCVAGNKIAEDYLDGKVNAEGIQAILQPVDETLQSVVAKRKQMEGIVAQWPSFRAGLFQLGVTWLQLHRTREALEVLERYHQLDPTDPSVEYYLAVLNAERFDFNKAWERLRQAERLVAAKGHQPKALKAVKQELLTVCAE